MGRDLIMLTHQYPHSAGDASFVEAEIWSLAESFDRVFVWTLAPSSAKLVSMPPNVFFLGSLLPRAASDVRLLALAVRHFSACMRMIRGEIKDRGNVVRIRRLLRSTSLAVLGGHRLGAWLREYSSNDQDPVLYSFWGTDCALTLLSLGIARRRIVVRLHGYDLYEERVGYLPFRRKLFEAADALVTVSKHGADYLTQSVAGDYELPPVVVSRLGTPDSGVGQGAPSEVVRVVSCSSLIALKRVDAIFEVVNSIAADVPVHWVHFGDGPLRNELEMKLAQRSPGLSVELRGTVSRAEIFDFYRSTPISMFINLSTTEGLPVSIMEALSFGIPVLATDVGGTSEIVGRELKSGVLVPARASQSEFVAAATEVIDVRSQWDPRSVWNRLCNAETNGNEIAQLLNSCRWPEGNIGAY